MEIEREDWEAIGFLAYLYSQRVNADKIVRELIDFKNLEGIFVANKIVVKNY